MAAKIAKKQKAKTKTSTKAAKKTVKAAVKAKAKTPSKKPIAKKSVKKVAKKPVVVKKTVKKPLKKPVVVKKATQKPIAKSVKTAKKAALKPMKAANPVAVKPVKETTPKVKKVSTRKKKPTKMDKKMARTLVKIANAAKTSIANVGIKSAVSAAMKATVALAAANANSEPMIGAVVAQQQAANTNQPANATAKGEKPAFKTGDMVVYPAHGVGKVEGIESHTVGGQEVKLFKITFEHERMTLKVPMIRATGSGLRQLSNKETMKNVFETMKGRPRVRRVMWSRRAQEYEQKINSGDPVAIAEVLRDLRRNAESGEQSYSERQIFNNALERLAREVAAIDRVTQEKAVEKLHNLLVRSKPSNVLVEASNDDEAEDAA
jgi:CarD family transcriptional regulator